MKGINKQFRITLLILVIIFSLIIAWNIIRHYLIAQAIEAAQPVIAVSTATAQLGTWHPSLNAIGTLAAINGVSVSSQASGNVVTINFQSGQKVKKGDLLIQIDDRSEQAALQTNLANLKFAEVTYLRNKALVQKGAVSQEAFDEANAKFQVAQAAVTQTQTALSYKHITAPFDGKLGIRTVDLGQYVRPGDNLVFLEAMDPLYVNFYLPEKNLHDIYINQPITVKVDPLPNRLFKGKINAINSIIDVETHNILIQATVPNLDEKLYPGLFGRIIVILPEKQNVVSVPQTAINYTLYGDTVYVIKKEGRDKKGDIYKVILREVNIGEQRDNKVIISKGLKAGEQVVSSGQLKLSNGQRVVINNAIRP